MQTKKTQTKTETLQVSHEIIRFFGTLKVDELIKNWLVKDTTCLDFEHCIWRTKKASCMQNQTRKRTSFWQSNKFMIHSWAFIGLSDCNAFEVKLWKLTHCAHTCEDSDSYNDFKGHFWDSSADGKEPMCDVQALCNPLSLCRDISQARLILYVKGCTFNLTDLQTV